MDANEIWLEVNRLGFFGKDKAIAFISSALSAQAAEVERLKKALAYFDDGCTCSDCMEARAEARP